MAVCKGVSIALLIIKKKACAVKIELHPLFKRNKTNTESI